MLATLLRGIEDYKNCNSFLEHDECMLLGLILISTHCFNENLTKFQPRHVTECMKSEMLEKINKLIPHSNVQVGLLLFAHR